MQVYGILITKQEVVGGMSDGPLHFMRCHLNKEEAMGGGGKK